MLILIFVHDMHKHLNKCVSCQILSYCTWYAGLSKDRGPLIIAAYGGNGIGGETTRVWGAKRPGLKIEAKRPGGKRLGGETSCYRQNEHFDKQWTISHS